MKSTEMVFCDLNEPLDLKKAGIEASRCYYCYDAPCIQACPTHIDIPSFIRKIGNGNIRGAALDILGSNILGGTCARACPVETLCQEACVREASEQKPVEIGKLQRFATDEFFKTGEQPFKRDASTGKKIAVVGAGPAGLACAHELARFGHDVTIYEAKPKSGGLNEYGLAPYKMMNDFAQKEVQFVLSIGGIRVEHGKRLGKDVKLAELRSKYDAVFLGIGLGDVNHLNLSGEENESVIDAVKFIEKIRQAPEPKKLPIGRHVIVIGGGNTAVDIAIQMKQLGSEFVTLAYRRGEEQMGATKHEQELAQKNGVLIKTWSKPHQIHLEDGRLSGMEFEYTRLDASGKLVGTGDTFFLKADQVFKAIGQKLLATELLADAPDLKLMSGKIVVNEQHETSIPGVYAGGDCIELGEDLTVTSVEQGKQSARAIHQKLGGKLRG